MARLMIADVSLTTIITGRENAESQCRPQGRQHRTASESGGWPIVVGTRCAPSPPAGWPAPNLGYRARTASRQLPASAPPPSVQPLPERHPELQHSCSLLLAPHRRLNA